MDAIVFSAELKTFTNMSDAFDHLSNHEELHWRVGFRIDRNSFSFPMLAYIHSKGEQVEYKVVVREIIPLREHLEIWKDLKFREKVMPKIWWNEDLPNCRNVLVITRIDHFSYDTWKLRKFSDGQFLKNPPQGYCRVISPEDLQRNDSGKPSAKAQQKARELGLRSAKNAEENFHKVPFFGNDDLTPGQKEACEEEARQKKASQDKKSEIT